jgi:membrane protease YdiL (CAAX protease family)
VRRVWALQALIGFGLGLLLVGTMFLIELAAGWLVPREVAAAGAAAALAVGLGRALLVAAIEETIFRGLILEYLRRPIGTLWAVAVSSIAFAAVHGFNSNATPLALINLAVAGALFALAYLVGRGLALPIGLHAGWNWFEGSVFGFPVSGSTRDSMLQPSVSGPEWATGGAFGPEGGVVGLVAMGIVALVLWLLRHRLPLPPEPARGAPAA